MRVPRPSTLGAHLDSRAWTRRRKKLEETTRYDPAEVEARVFAEWMEGGYFHPEAEGTPEENFSVAIPPPNVTGALHMGHALNGSMQDALVRMNRMRGPQHALDPRHRPRRHRHPGGGRERAARGRQSPPGARPRGVRRAGLGVERGVRLADRRAVQAARRLLRLRARALHPRRGLRHAPSTASSSSSTTRATSTATTTWSTGTRARARRSPTSRSRTARSRTRSTRSTTRSRAPTGC